MSKFLNLDDVDPMQPSQLGGGLKKRKTRSHQPSDKSAVARAGEAHGFTRATGPEKKPTTLRRGRPPLNETMTYWRIYISPDLRDELNALRDQEGRRLNDVLKDMLKQYKHRE